MDVNEVIKALRYCDKVVNKTEETLQCGVCPLFEECYRSGQIAADLLERQQEEIAKLKELLKLAVADISGCEACKHFDVVDNKIICGLGFPDDGGCWCWQHQNRLEELQVDG